MTIVRFTGTDRLNRNIEKKNIIIITLLLKYYAYKIVY